jgi:thiamine pyrophosphate-dependent acetolactate synthase large subunit-like protein
LGVVLGDEAVDGGLQIDEGMEDLGWGMPAAIGTSLGLDRQPVVAVLGDGSAMYSPQALWTAAHEQVPVTFVVMNNREYNILKHAMRRRTAHANAMQSRFLGMELTDPPIDFVGMAKSLSLAARTIRGRRLVSVFLRRAKSVEVHHHHRRS